ncbi:MAG: hypothetical protein AAB074_20090 [Planctomycetota bacterium]
MDQLTGKPRLTEAAESLFRQIHPKFFVPGTISSQAFRPGTEDEGMLSVSRGSLTTAKEAHALYTGKKGRPSDGVVDLAVQDFADQQLSVYEDPETAPVVDPAHALVDFSALTKTEVKTVATRLRDKAILKPLAFDPRKKLEE